MDRAESRPRRGPNYRDLRFHAAGALGEVFLARNAELNREVALKFLKPGRARDPESLRRFLQEAEITGRLEHPGVVPIYALGTDAAGATCYAMRFIRGETLQNAIDALPRRRAPGRDHSERSLGLRELLDRFVSVCSTVGYAHSRGILHRDLKPRNVMLGKYDETLVVDWGLAKPFEPDKASGAGGEEPLTPSSADSSSDTPTVGVVGTLAYMSPEQGEARWDLVGPASDIFSLGAILYAILTGLAPYGWHTPRRDPRQGQAVRVPHAPADQAGGAAGPGGDLPEGDGPRAGGPLRDGARPGRRRETLAGRSAGGGLARATLAPCAAVDAAASDAGDQRGGRAAARRLRAGRLRECRRRQEPRARCNSGSEPRNARPGHRRREGSSATRSRPMQS